MPRPRPPSGIGWVRWHNLVKQLNKYFSRDNLKKVILRDSHNDSNGLRNDDLELHMDPVILSWEGSAPPDPINKSASGLPNKY